MPFVRIEMREGKSQEFKRAVLDGVHEALVEALRLPADDRTQRLYELPPERFEFPEDRRDDLILIEITMFRGRSDAAKRLLHKLIAERLRTNPGVEPRNVAVVLHEPPPIDWSFGGLSAADDPPGFKIDV